MKCFKFRDTFTYDTNLTLLSVVVRFLLCVCTHVCKFRYLNSFRHTEFVVQDLKT